MSLQYSAGGSIEFIKGTVSISTSLDRRVRRSKPFIQFKSLDADGRFVWHFSLGTEDYWYIALRLICFGLLTGYADQMDRIMPIIDYVRSNT